MSEKTFDHEIYRIAHPVMRKLIQQAIQAREFQAIFPKFHKELMTIKEKILKQLISVLTEIYKERTSMFTDNIKCEVETIIFGRRLLDHVLAYCQNKEIYAEDEFLLQNLLLSDELKSIYDQLYTFFWEQVKQYEKLTGMPDYAIEFKNYLRKNELKLPNLLLSWDAKILFIDYLKIYIQYHDYKNSKVKKTKISQEPTFEEAKQVLKPLDKYPSPLPTYNSSFIGESSNFVCLNLNLDENPKKLPEIMADFLYQFQAQKLDHDRQGTNTQLPINSVLLMKIHELRNILDNLTNSLPQLNRADAVLTALISLIYYDLALKEKVLRGNLQEFETSNLVKLSLESYLDPSCPDYEAKMQILDNKRYSSINRTDYDCFANLMPILQATLQANDQIKVKPSKQGVKNFTLTCSLEGSIYEHKISEASLKKRVDVMIGKLSSNLAEIALL